MLFGRLVLLLCAACICVSQSDDSGGVLALTPETFDSTLAQHDNLLVVFFAPWCGHCKPLQADLRRVVTRLKHKKVPAAIATLDGAAFPKFVDRRGVTGFPTFYMYRFGVFHSEYVGERTDRHITDFITRKTSAQIVTRLDSLRELLAFCSEKDGSLDPAGGSAEGSGASFLGSSSDEEQEHAHAQAIYPYLSVHEQMKREMLSFVLGLFPRRAASGNGDTGTNRSIGELAFMTVATETEDASSFAITDNEWLLEHFEVTEDTVIAFGGGPGVSAQVIGRLALDAAAVSAAASSPDAPGPPQRAAGGAPLGADSGADLADERQLAEHRLLTHRISEFLGSFAMPLITPFSSTTVALIDSSEVRVHLLLFLDEDRFGPYIGELLTGLSRLAHLNRGQMLFVQISSSEHQILSLFGLTAEDYPVAMVADLRVAGNMRRYMMRDADTVTEAMLEAIDAETEGAAARQPSGRLQLRPLATALVQQYVAAVGAHIDSFQAGEASPSIFSAAPTEDPAMTLAAATGAEPPVARTVVGMNFDEVVVRGSGDVFLFIYVPWCAYCKAFETVLKELVNHYTQARGQLAGQPPEKQLYTSMTVAKLEGGANEVIHPGVRILGYPSLFLFLEGNKSHPIEYDGERSLTALVQWISGHQRERLERGGDWRLEAKIDQHKHGANTNAARVARERRIHEKIQEQKKRAETRTALESESDGGGAARGRRGSRRPMIHHNPAVEPSL